MDYQEKRIVFMGTPDFAVPALSLLAENGYNVVGAVTQPDKPKGRTGALQAPPVKEKAEALGIPVFQPVKVRNPEFVETLKNLAPDLIIVAAFGQIIPRSILDIPQYGCINIHGSLLPKYRGAAPIQHAVIDGEKESGVTIMQMGEGLDTGDMLARASVELAPDETGGSLFEKLSLLGAETLIEILPDLFAGDIIPEKQPEESPTPYAGMLTKQMGILDFEKPAEELERLVRGLSPWPGACTFLGEKNLKIWKSRVQEQNGGTEAVPGTVLSAGEDGIHVQCAEGILVLTEIQLEGKKRMDTASFLRGCKIQAGQRLGKNSNS
ncbi:MAG: methionyl-tRNA formyltransferase [Blautia sp.]|nr:methionyl-tRNA formyltransferase [Blautia sp.]